MWIIDSNLFYSALDFEVFSMKQMVYQSERKNETLYSGTYKEYDFYIMNLGTHPTAYINVINDIRYCFKDYDEVSLGVHGGLTYSNRNLRLEDRIIDGWFIGWDYGHYNDYAGYEMAFPSWLQSNGKKWTTEEIFEEVKNAIEQLIKGV